MAKDYPTDMTQSIFGINLEGKILVATESSPLPLVNT
jgi:hypothetical protein